MEASTQDGAAKKCLLVAVTYGLLNIALLVLGFGGIERFVFVGSSVVAGVLLYRLNGPAYTVFTWYIWFMAPFVRRVCDYHAGWENPSITLLTPYLVTLISLLSLPRYFAPALRIVFVPIGLVVTALLGGVLVGLANGVPRSVITEALGWFVPIVFSMYLLSNFEQIAEYQRAFIRAVVSGAVILSLYGLVQYTVAPAWDRFWLENLAPDLVDPSFGLPAPFEIRPFSTLNSPGTLATTLVMGLLLILTRKTVWMGIPVVSTLILTGIRVAWVALAVGLIGMVFIGSGDAAIRIRRKLVLLVSTLLVAALVLTTVPIVREGVSERFSSFGNLRNDESVNGRALTYEVVFAYSAQHPLGDGMSKRAAFGDLALDSALEALLLSLGWIGTVLFVIGIGWLMTLVVITPVYDTDSTVMRLSALALLSMAPAGNSFWGPAGMLIWTPIAICLAILARSKAIGYGVTLPAPRNQPLFELRVRQGA